MRYGFVGLGLRCGPLDSPRASVRNILDGAPASPATIGCMSGESQTEAIVSPDASARPPAGAPVNPSAQPKSRVEGEVIRLRALLEQGQYAAALAEAKGLLAEVPENRDVWYAVAVSQRYLQRIPDALSTLAQLERLHPNYSRLYQERGHCHVALREAAPAIEAFLRAVNINPALPASWKALQALFTMTGRKAEADIAAAHVERLAQLPAQVVTATSMFADGEIFPAERLIRDYLLTHGNHIEAMRLLAKIGMKLEVYDDAELLLESVLVLAPDYHAARYDYALSLLARHKHVRALEELDKLLKIDPDNRAYRTTRATACVGVGDHEQALQIYRALLAGAPPAAVAELHLSIAHALKTLGRQPEAIESYRAAAACRPSFGDAYWSLANLKTFRFPEADLERMRAAESSASTSLVDRYHLCFALGKALEDRGEYAESFRHYEAGNALKKGEIRFRIEPIERNARLQACVCTREFFASRQAVGSPDPSPIFIVGLPRAGSTLLEQILASHSKVEGTMELRISRGSRSSSRAARQTNRSRATRECWRNSMRIGSSSSAKNISPTLAYTAPASPTSSTRCRTTSGTSGSFI